MTKVRKKFQELIFFLLKPTTSRGQQSVKKKITNREEKKGECKQTLFVETTRMKSLKLSNYYRGQSFNHTCFVLDDL